MTEPAVPGVEEHTEALARMIAPKAFEAFDRDYRTGQLGPSLSQMNAIGHMNAARNAARAFLAPILAEKEREIERLKLNELKVHCVIDRAGFSQETTEDAVAAVVARALAAEAEKERLERILDLTRQSRVRWFASTMHEQRKREAAEAALAATKEASRQAVMAFFDELAARGIDQDMMADAMEALADKSDAAVAEARAAAIRAQGE